MPETHRAVMALVDEITAMTATIEKLRVRVAHVTAQRNYAWAAAARLCRAVWELTTSTKESNIEALVSMAYWLDRQINAAEAFENKPEVAPAPNAPNPAADDPFRGTGLGVPPPEDGDGKAGGDHTWEQQCKRCGTPVLAGDDFEYNFCALCYKAGWRFSRGRGLYKMEGDD